LSGYERSIKPPFVAFDGPGSIIATAIHAGHLLRPEISDLMRLDGPTRLREEDPYTDILTEAVPPRVVVDRSRFEVDLNHLATRRFIARQSKPGGWNSGESHPALQLSKPPFAFTIGSMPKWPGA
jgi:hypothetical protein